MIKPALLLILDGWGIAPAGPGNVLSLVDLPTFKRLKRDDFFTKLDAAGEGIGLPAGHQGSSEMGHLMIGAGRPVVFPQNQVKSALAHHAVQTNAAYNEVMDYCALNDQALHLVGLLSDRGVHAYAELAYQLIALAKIKQLKRVFIHIIADGRDTLPTELPRFVSELEQCIQAQGVGTIATVIGRYYAMDRDQRWERVEKAYRMYVEGEANTANDIHRFLAEYYAQPNGDLPATDEFIPPTRFDDASSMKAGDGVIFWNFRVDRAVELTQAMTELTFSHFERKLPMLHFVATTAYYDEIKTPVAFSQEHIKEPLGKVLADVGARQLRIAETEKWAYITKILDGYQEISYPYETKKLLPSDKVATYDLAPQMQAAKIADTIIEALQSEQYDVIIANFANADMVAHTANLEATKIAVQAVDEAVNRIDAALKEKQGFMCITADHGNCEQMLTESGGKHGSHTANQVPFYLINYNPLLVDRLNGKRLQSGSLMNVAPTFLDLMGIVIPSHMTYSLVL